MEVEGNTTCADCDTASPEWLSMNLGVTLCVNCSGVHRSLGVHISKVRSINMDKLDEITLEYMKAIGNTRANAIWERALKPEQKQQKRNPEAPRQMREMYIKAKYQLKSFVDKAGTGQEEANQLLFTSLAAEDALGIVQALAWDAEIKWPNPAQDGRTALHQATYSSPHCMELLVQNVNNEDLAVEEVRGWSPLHYAAFLDEVNMVTILLVHGGPRLSLKTDVEGFTPLEIANYYHDNHPLCGPLLKEYMNKIANKPLT